MKVELSEDMIYKIASMSHGRMTNLQAQLEVHKIECSGVEETRRMKIRRTDLEKSIANCEEVHEYFSALLNEIEEG